MTAPFPYPSLPPGCCAQTASSPAPTPSDVSGCCSAVAEAAVVGKNSSSETDMDTGTCDVFVGPDGGVMEVMCCDYGFRSGFGRLYQGEDGEIPLNIFQLVITSPC